jgi:hypothetical protein
MHRQAKPAFSGRCIRGESAQCRLLLKRKAWLPHFLYSSIKKAMQRVASLQPRGRSLREKTQSRTALAAHRRNVLVEKGHACQRRGCRLRWKASGYTVGPTVAIQPPCVTTANSMPMGSGCEQTHAGGFGLRSNVHRVVGFHQVRACRSSLGEIGSAHPRWMK